MAKSLATGREGNMRRARTTKVGIGAAGVLTAALLLGACSTGSAHVIGPPPTASTTVPTTAPTTTPTTGAPVPTTAPVTVPSGGISPSGGSAASGALSPSTEAQINAELNQLNASLNEAQQDLSNPNQGDE
jgi:hypothetical protein